MFSFPASCVAAWPQSWRSLAVVWSPPFALALRTTSGPSALLCIMNLSVCHLACEDV